MITDTTLKLIVEFAKTSKQVDRYQLRPPKTAAAKKRANALNAKSWKLYDALAAAGLNDYDFSQAASSFSEYENADREGATLDF